MTSQILGKHEILLNLKKGLDVEYKALEGYEDFLYLVNDKADRNMIEMIIADERKHVKMVEELISIVNENL